MICHVCQGSGNQTARKDGKLEWWPCPACGGQGVTFSGLAPTEIKLGKSQNKFCRTLNEKDEVVQKRFR